MANESYWHLQNRHWYYRCNKTGKQQWIYQSGCAVKSSATILMTQARLCLLQNGKLRWSCQSWEPEEGLYRLEYLAENERLGVVQQGILCPVCDGILRDAVKVTCGGRFCQECYQDLCKWVIQHFVLVVIFGNNTLVPYHISCNLNYRVSSLVLDHKLSCNINVILLSHICVDEMGQKWFRQWLVNCSALSHYLK